jgi:hypothetical protein
MLDRLRSKKPRLASALPLAFVVTVSCGDSSLLLKPPLMAGCQKAGLPKCPELSDGVIQYVDGDKAKAEATIRVALVGASPEKVQALVLVLKSLPGASDRLAGVIDFLEGKGSSGASSTLSSGASSEAGNPSGGTEISGFTHLRAATIEIVGNPRAKGCEALTYAGASEARGLCLEVAEGPLVVTDLQWPDGCPAETFAAAGNSDQPIWFLHTENGKGFVMHGGALIVPAGAPFFAGHRFAGATATQPSLPCAVTWAGRRP